MRNSSDSRIFSVVLRRSTELPALRDLPPYQWLSAKERPAVEPEEPLFLGIPDTFPPSLTFTRDSLSGLLMSWWEPHHFRTKGLATWNLTALSPETEWMTIKGRIGAEEVSFDFPASPETKLCRGCARPCELFMLQWDNVDKGEAYSQTCPGCRLDQLWSARAWRKEYYLKRQGQPHESEVFYYQQAQSDFIKSLHLLAQAWWKTQQETLSPMYIRWQESETRDPLDLKLGQAWSWLEADLVWKTVNSLRSEVFSSITSEDSSRPWYKK